MAFRRRPRRLRSFPCRRRCERMQEVGALSFHPGELDRADVRELLAFHFAEMRGNSPPEACHVLPGDGLRAPEISFWTVRQDGRLLGLGALKGLASDHGEIKSMRTAPEALGQGIGRAMLRHLLEEARRRG